MAHYDAEVGGSFLQRKKQPTEKGPPGKETPKALPYDGYFNFGCYMDESPKDARLDYKEEMERLFEEKQPVSAKVCFEFCRDRPEYKFFALTHGLYKFLNGHDVQSALAAGGASLDGVMAEGKSGKPPSAMNRMTEAAIAELGCDDEPADGCDGFNLIYWPQGPTAEWFSDFYIPADNSPAMSAEEWKLQFMWMCKDLCDHFDGCVAGDVYGSVEDGAEQYSANCALKKSVNRVLMSVNTGEPGAFGYGFDQGFIIEGYFQIVKDELPFII